MRRSLQTFFRRHNPARLPAVDCMARQYDGRPGDLLDALRRNYGTAAVGDLEADLAAAATADPSPVAGNPRASLPPVRYTYPDADSTAPGEVLADDVTCMNATPVARIFQPRCVDDVLGALAVARASGLGVAMRGTQHSMGGQSLAPGGVVLDLKRLRAVAYDPATTLVTCGPGATWGDLIEALNPHGRSPTTMQSYCSFSVGGTVAVNGHGITTDRTVGHSVVAMTVVTAVGDVVECRRDDEDPARRELFRAVIGGYGLFGVVVSLTMRTATNTTLATESLTVPYPELGDLLDAVAADPDVDIKLSRVDITTLETATLYIFRRTQPHGIGTVSPLRAKPNEGGLVQQMLFKWLAPTLKEARFAVERARGTALDWDEAHDRNTLMHESAGPLSRLTSPLLAVDDTFILQEYFVPKALFRDWVRLCRPIYRDLDGAESVTLLNTTVRIVEKDEDSLLPYAAVEGGVFAFVLYYRIHRTADGDARLAAFHDRFAAAVLSLGGTFYLPYRHHYSDAQLRAAYPSLDAFAAVKQRLDPDGLFDNAWWRRYGLPACTDEYRAAVDARRAAAAAALQSNPALLFPATSDGSAPGQADQAAGVRAGEYVPVAAARRADSYGRLLRDHGQRQRFFELFLTEVFAMRSPKDILAAVQLAHYDASNHGDDDAIYADVHARLQKAGQLTQLATGWRAAVQMHRQREQLSVEVMRVLHRLGMAGGVRNYVAIGDHGKLVRVLRERCFAAEGVTWVVHDAAFDDTDVAAAMERSSAGPVGDAYVEMDYRHRAVLEGVGSGEADLVTMLQGLHHIPQDHRLPEFLREVHRVLRPGGVFIVREHDATAALMPTLDLAHSIFNAVTGVSPKDDRAEVRAFRPVAEWRRIVESFGFADTMVYECQPDDPTCDEMLCFVKLPYAACPSVDHAPAPASIPASRLGSTDHAETAGTDGATPGAAAVAALTEAPGALIAILSRLLDTFDAGVPQLEAFLVSLAPLGSEDVVRSLLRPVSSPALAMACRFRPILANARETAAAGRLTSGGGGGSMLEVLAMVAPPDLYYGFLAVARRVEQGRATPMETLLFKAAQAAQASLTGEGDGAEGPSEGAATAATPDAEARPETAPTVAEVTERLEALVAVFPDFFTAGFWARAGVDDNVRQMLLSRGASVEAAAAFLHRKLDRAAWTDFTAAVGDICAARQPPHIDMLRAFARTQTADPGPWVRATVAVLGAPKVQVTAAGRMMASFAGYGDLVELWSVSQRLRAAKAAASATADTSEGALDHALRGLEEGNVREVVVELPAADDIADVARVIRVEHRGHDITEFARRQMRGATLRLRNVDWDTEMLYTSLNNTVLGQWLGGRGSLRIRYLSSERLPPHELLPRVETVTRALIDKGIALRPSSHSKAHATWYKLAEWLQVEVCKGLAHSLDHTPWYRYPYMGVMRQYFAVAADAFRATRRHHGMGKALLSSGFATAAVPGVVMSVLFAQLQLLATPVRMQLGDAYAAPSTMVERLVFSAAPFGQGKGASHWPQQLQELCGRPQVLHEPKGGLPLYAVSVPVFKPFTEALLLIARYVPTAHAVSLSGHPRVMIRLSVPARTSLADARPGSPVLAPDALLKTVPTVEVVSAYALPFSTNVTRGSVHTTGLGGDHVSTVAVSVAVPYLLELLRLCERHQGDGIRVEQVYDFWA